MSIIMQSEVNTELDKMLLESKLRLLKRNDFSFSRKGLAFLTK